MANTTWNGSNDNWETAGDWSDGVLPDASDDVVINGGQPQITSATNAGTIAGLTDNASLKLNDGALTVTGAVSVASNDSLDIDSDYNEQGSSLSVGGALTNSGTIDLATYGPSGADSLTVTGTLTNSGTLNVGNGGLGASTTVTLGGLVDTGTINLSGNTSAGTTAKATLNAGGSAAPATLAGTIAVSGDALLEFASGQITSIANGAELYLSESDAQIDVVGNSGNDSALALASNFGTFKLVNGATYSTSGALNNTGNLYIDSDYNEQGSSLSVGGALTNSGTIDLATYGPSGADSLTVTGTLTNSGTLNVGNGGLGASTTVTLGGLVDTGTINLSGNTSAGTTAKATLNAGGSAAPATLAGTIAVSGDALLEFASGQITSIANGAELYLSESDAQIDVVGNSGNDSALALASNFGTFKLVNGATYSTSGALNNTGNLYIDSDYNEQGSSLSVGGALTNSGTIDLATYGPSGADSLTVTGTLTNSGTLNVGNGGLGTSTTVTLGGLVDTGTINLSGNTSAGTTAKATLNAGGSAAPATLAGTIAVSGDALLEFASGQITSIANGAELYLSESDAQIDVVGNSGNDSALALASNFGTFKLVNGATYSTSGALNNTGNLYIDSDYNEQGSSLSVGGALTNSGTIDLATYGPSGADSLTVTGTLTNSGTLNVGNGGLGASTTVTLGGLVDTGTINLSGNTSAGTTAKATLNAGSSAAPATLAGTIAISGDALLQYASGEINSITSGGSISLSQSDAQLDTAGNAVNNSALTGLSSNAGSLQLENGASVAPIGNFSNTGKVLIDDTGYGEGGSSLLVGGTLTNSDEIDIGNTGLSASDEISANAIVNTNTGGIYLRGNGANQALLNVNSAAGFGTAGVLTGTVGVGWNGSSNSVVEFASGEIASIATNALLDISSSNSFVADADSLTSNSALTGLTSNAGTLQLEAGASVAPTGDFANTGYVRIDDTGYGEGGSSLLVGGTLTNSDEIDIGNTGLSASDEISANAIVNTNTGGIYLRGNGANQALLNVNAAAGFGTAGVVTGTVGLGWNGSSNSVVEFASGEIASIATNALLDISSSNSFVADADSLTSNSALIGLTSNAGTLQLEAGASVAPTGDFTNTSYVRIDDTGYGEGGSSLLVGGTLTNSDEIDIGNTGLSASDEISANAIVNTNTGGIYLRGNGANQALLNVNAAAGFGTAGVVTGTVGLGWNGSSNSVVEFASGEIASIATNALLDISSSNSFVADAGSLTSNSALIGLTSNAGTLQLEAGASVAPTGDFTNTSYVRIDDTGYGEGGSSLLVGGTLTNSDEIDIGNTGLSASDEISANAIVNTNTGGIYLRGNGANQALLNVNSAAGFGTAGVLTGTVGLGWNGSSNSVVEFASGEIASIATNALLDISSSNSFVADVGSLTSNSALTGLTSNAGTLQLEAGASVAPTGDFSNTGYVRIDDTGYGEGGSSLLVGGALTNSDEIDIGNTGLSASDRVTAGSVVNSGLINLYSAGSQATLAATGLVENSGNLNAYFDSTVTAGSFQQDATGEVTLEIQGTDAAHHGTVTTTGSVTLNGGTFNAPTYNYTYAAGQTFDLFSFAAGKLVGMFSDLGNQADGATFNLGNGLLLGLEYDNNAGVIEEKIVTAPASAADSWIGGSADFGTVADWSNGAPDFYSAVTISTSAAATVTLSVDTTIDSLVIGAKDTLSTKAATDLSIGTTLSVAGALTIGGEAFVDGATANSGVITVNGTVLDLRGAVTGIGGFTIGAGAELEFGGSDAETVTFNGAAAELKLDQPGAFSGTLANLAVGDIIDLAGITVANPVVTGGTKLTFTDSNNVSYAYTLTGFPGGASFVAHTLANGDTQLVVVAPSTNVTINPVDGTNSVNAAQAAAGITVTGTVSGLLTGATFSLNVVDGSVNQIYTATVGASGTTWSAAIPAGALKALSDGSASFTADVSAATQAAETVVIHESLPVVTLAKIDGNNFINLAEAQAGVAVSGSATGLASGAMVSIGVVDGLFSKTYTATVNGSGGWSTTIPAADATGLANGTATVTAQATDAYGNVSALSTQSVTVQETPPTLTLNQVEGDNIINHAQAAAGVTLSGGSMGLLSGSTFTVTVKDGAFTGNYQASVGTGGAWTATIPASDATNLGNGVNAATVSAQAFDAAGNPSAVVSETVTVEGNAPSLTIAAIDGNNVINHAEAAAGVAITGTSTGLASGAQFNVSVVDNGVTTTYLATEGANNAWTATIPASAATALANGTATFSAQATDAYGNVSAVATQTVTVQETLPTLTMAAIDGNNVINHAEAAAGVAITGTSTGLASGAQFNVSVVDNGVTTTYKSTVGTNNAWTATIPASAATALANGTATFSAQATDAYGNVSAVATQTVNVQETLPTLTIAAIDGNNVINHAEAAAGVAITGGSTGLASGAQFNVTVVDGGVTTTYLATEGANNAWTATIPASAATALANGTATFSAQATDAYGNVSAVATQTVNVQETLPMLTIAAIDGNNVINHAEAAAGVAITGGSTGLASGATFNVSVVDNGVTTTYKATEGANNAWTATIPASAATALANGTATFSAQATDAYGNVSAVATQTVNVQETLPTLTIAAIDGNNVINHAEAAAGVAITGTSTGLASGAQFNVTVVDGGVTTTYLATEGANNAWTATIPASAATALANGTATFSAQATDAYGNVSAVATQTVNVQETLPTLTIAAIDGNNVINHAEAAAGIAITGTSTGLASGAQFNVSVVDNGVTTTYKATVGTNNAWTATIPTSAATALANGTATFSAQATDAYGNVSAVATQTVNVQETLPTLTIAAIDGTDIINQTQAAAGVAISGTSTGLTVGQTFTVSVVDGTDSKAYTASVGVGGAWTATIPAADALALPGGTATVSAQATDAYGNVSATASQIVTVQTSATVTINKVDGDNVINYAQAHAAGGVALSGTVTGLAFGATFGVNVVDGAFNKTYTATVGANGVWTATIPTKDAQALADGSATVTATAATGVTISETVTVAETPSAFTAIADNPATGDLDAGKIVTLTLTSNQAVTVTGAPTLTLNDGATATFDSGKSTTTSLVFDYTVQAGDNTTALRADAVNLNGGAILDAAGNAALLSLGGLAQKGPQIDTTPPEIVGLTETPATGDVGLGKIVTLYLSTSEAVTVSGTPVLTLNDGGTATYYAAGSSASKLAFRTTIAAGQSSPDLQALTLTLNGGAILDLAGNAADLSLANLTQLGPDVSGVAPTITAIAETPASGDLDAGKTVTLSLSVSEAVTVTGAPHLTLNDGGTATYDAAKSTATSLVFDCTVAAGQNTAALAVTALSGGAIVDAFGNAVNPSIASLTQTGPKIDTTAPTFTAVTETPASGDLDAGKTVTLALTTSEAVVVTGAPTLTLNDGGTATFDAAKSTATSLVFDYTVAAGQNIAALKTTAVNLAGGSIDDLAGNVAKLSLTGLTQTGPQIDTTPPKFTAVAETPATGDLDAGKTVTLRLATSEAVVVTGAPTLTLNDNGTATYDAAKSTATSLAFDYTVATGQNTAALKVSAVNLGGGTIDDLAGNAANLSLTGLAQAGPQIDTTPPTFTAVAETSASGDLDAGKTVTLTLTASEAVAVTGAPTLLLNDGGTAIYDAAESSTTKLAFDYTVAPGQNVASLAAASVNINSGTIDDLAGNAAVLSLTGLTQKGPQIDTTAPTVVSVSGSPASGDVLTGQTEAITLTLSEAAKVTGTPELVLSDGGLATYASGSGTNALTFDYKVLAGQQSSDLELVGSSVPAGSSIADLAGNPLLLPHAPVNLNVGVNNFVTLTGSEAYEIAGPSNLDVTFASNASADLILTDSVGYTGHLTGLGTADTLDLADLVWGASDKATYAGTATGGTLTVTDGAHQAAIALLGNYLNSTFTLSNDGYGGVNVVDPLRSTLAAHASA